eukprot:TRINITY_DN17375_c0_g1_i1.p4 TRINITY_DN17375_c0_g1~~TRINITY_DN17375_c0_g1_i1.p4  ORF type:complete len:103 (-),score=3.46 TRINITY_DN17375_c0_g1_i1:509-817(-)
MKYLVKCHELDHTSFHKNHVNQHEKKERHQTYKIQIQTTKLYKQYQIYKICEIPNVSIHVIKNINLKKSLQLLKKIFNLGNTGCFFNNFAVHKILLLKNVQN